VSFSNTTIVTVVGQWHCVCVALLYLTDTGESPAVVKLSCDDDVTAERRHTAMIIR